MGKYILAAVLGYLIGNISSSYIVGKVYKNIDIRNYGSGNAGATNTFRVLGFKPGLIVFICDVIKGIIATLIGSWITSNQTGAIITGIFAVIGHDWPVVLGFNGGKGIATSFGMMLTVFPKISAILFVACIIIIFTTKYVSLASITAAVLFPFLLALFDQPAKIVILGVVLCLLALIRHKDNIIRLLSGKENKMRFRKSGESKMP